MKNHKKSCIFILYSLIGIVMFFVPVSMNGKTTIPIDHVVTFIRQIPYFTPVYGLTIITLGGLMPFYKKTWNRSKVNIIFSFLGLVGIIFVFMTVFHVGPKILIDENMMPYVYNIVVVPVVAIVPIGSIFLAFIVSFGLMEFVGHFMTKVMRPIFKTPGRSAIDAVASFVGSYSIALLVTNRIYKEGKYTTKEACIIATGFSTVSATFMVIVAKTLKIMEYWNLFFWLTFFITFVITAISARLYPLKSKEEKCYQHLTPVEEPREKISLKRAWALAMEAFDQAPSLVNTIVDNIKDGITLAMSIGPNIMSIGVLALLLANYSSIFDYLGLIFYPLSKLLQIPEAMLFSKGVAVSLADMYVPAMLLKDANIKTRMITAIISISEVLFFSASIPCILATDIPISVKDIVIIWFERVVLTILIATPIVFFIFRG